MLGGCFNLRDFDHLGGLSHGQITGKRLEDHNRPEWLICQLIEALGNVWVVLGQVQGRNGRRLIGSLKF